jgi:hypothetical protein
VARMPKALQIVGEMHVVSETALWISIEPFP